MSALRASCAVVLGLALASCQPQAAEAPPPSGEPVAIPPGHYGGLAWLPSDWIVLARPADAMDLASPLRLYRFRPDDPELEEVEVPDVDCTRVQYRMPTALPDGRLGAVRSCYSPSGGVIPRAEIIALDVESGELEVLTDLEELGNVNAGQMTWSPTLERGFLSHGSGICQGILALTRQGVEYPEIEISEGSATFTLDEIFDRPIDCEATGQADDPAWSPTADEVALFASPRAVGVSGFQRANVPYGLYVMATDDHEVRRLFGDVVAPQGLAWLPDGDSVVFAGAVDGVSALWRVDTATGDLTEVASEEPAWLAISPDGDRIAVIVLADTNDEARLRELRLVPIDR